MKKIASFLFFVFLLINIQAQKGYLPTVEDLKHFHTTKTYVVLVDNPLSDYNLEIRAAVEKFWTTTPYEFIQIKDFKEKSKDESASFLYLAMINFEKDRTNARYQFLCLSLGGDHFSLDDMRDVASVPVSYYGVDEDHFSYKLGIMVRFLQDHVDLITENPTIVSKNVYSYYNRNISHLKGKTLYLIEDELAVDIETEAQIRAIYPYEVKVVNRDYIRELIMAEDEQAVVLHKVGPENQQSKARVYKMLIGVADAKLYYYDYHKINSKNPDAFLSSDLKKLLVSK